MASRILDIGLRALALLWTLLITALIGNVIASNVNAASSASMAVNFVMFVAAWSWITCLYGLLAALFTKLASPMVLLFWDGLAVLFTFVAAIVLAAKLGAIDCGNINSQHKSRSWIAFGSNNDAKRCREIQASTAFMWFLWACFCASLIFTVTTFRSSGSSFRSSKPSMSQVV